MEKQQVNPWTWQDQFGYSQAWRVDRPAAVIFVAGQGPLSAEGEFVGAGDFEAQARQTFENLRAVLDEAGASVDAIVKLNVYLTDIALLRDYSRIRAEYVPGPAPAGTAVQVVALAIPGMMLEVEAIAVV
jgi:enamine deaminase RidA (YjgF/YER057c/UK114 family)